MSRAIHALELTRLPVEASLSPGTAEALLEARWRTRCAEARAEGREEGLREALEGPARLLEEAAERLADSVDAARADLARDAVELGLGVARQLLRAALAAGHHDIEAIVRETLARSGVGRGACVVHLNPADAERLRHVVFRANTRLEADDDVPRGSVHVTTPKGLLVRDVDACMDAVGQRLRGEL